MDAPNPTIPGYAASREDRDIVDMGILAVIVFLGVNWLFGIFSYWGSSESLPKGGLMADGIKTVVLILLMVWVGKTRSLPATLVLLVTFGFCEYHVIPDVTTQTGIIGVRGHNMSDPSRITNVAVWLLKLLPLLFLYGGFRLIRAVLAAVRLRGRKEPESAN
jgi:hypothetical protein